MITCVKNASTKARRQVRRHVCTKCQKRFYSRDALDKHLNEYHIQQKLFKCKFCPKDFLREKNKFLHEENCEFNDFPIDKIRRKNKILHEIEYEIGASSSKDTQNIGITNETNSNENIQNGGANDKPELIQSALRNTVMRYQKRFDRSNQKEPFLLLKLALSEYNEIIRTKLLSEKMQIK